MRSTCRLASLELGKPEISVIMVQKIIDRSNQLKRSLVDFVYDAEGELAVSLETYAAQQRTKDLKQQNLVIDRFILEGRVGDKTPLELFLEDDRDLTSGDRILLQNWQRSFTGLFEIIQLFPSGVELMNWLTAKHYLVLFGQQPLPKDMARWQPGDILLTRIAPLNHKNDYWLFFSDIIFKGKLSKPKLAVAIGEFKQNYPDSLYADAPELLELAWHSVARYHQEFVDFFGSDRVDLPGYKLDRQLNKLQEKMTEQRLEAAGIDRSKSLQEVIQDAGEDEAEIMAAVEELGVDSKELSNAIANKEKIAMKLPKISLPDEIKKAEMVTVFSHPQWGQMLISTYSKFQEILDTEDPHNHPNAERLVNRYLEDPQINFFIWQQLWLQYPTKLEKLLQIILKNPDFNLEKDLGKTLALYNKPLEPELPEMASVPQHLHDLFSEAMIQVNKSKSKTKKPSKTKKGFHR
jgi:hypothetical protein